MQLHLSYEKVDPWPLKRLDVTDRASRIAGVPSKVMLKPDKSHGIISIDGETRLTGVPPEAWNYRMGIRSALEWVMDQYGESKPRDKNNHEEI